MEAKLQLLEQNYRMWCVSNTLLLCGEVVTVYGMFCEERFTSQTWNIYGVTTRWKHFRLQISSSDAFEETQTRSQMYERCVRTGTMHQAFFNVYSGIHKGGMCAPHAFFTPGVHMVLAEMAACNMTRTRFIFKFC